MLRKELGLTQKVIAERFRVSPGGYRHYEAGRARLALCDAPLLARALGVTSGYLLERLGVIESGYIPGTRRVSAAFEVPLARGAVLSAGDGQVWAFIVADDARLEPGVARGDVLLVDLGDRSPQDGDLVAVRAPEGQIRLKHYHIRHGQPALTDAQGGTEPAEGAQIEGVVVALLRRYR